MWHVARVINEFFLYLSSNKLSSESNNLRLVITGRACRSKNGFSAPRVTFIGAKVWEYNPQNCQKFEFWPEICTSGATRLQYFYEILSVCTRL